MALIIAIEVGYTQIRALLLETDPSGEVQTSRLPSNRGFIGRSINFQDIPIQPDLIHMVVNIANQVADGRHDEVTSIGVACAAAVSREGTLRLTGLRAGEANDQEVLQNEFPFLRPLRDELKALFTAENLKVVVANRAAMAAWGEYKYGWGNVDQKKNLVYLHVGGGVSAGIVTNGRLYEGESGYAGDFGHMLVDPTSQRICDVCQRTGCLSSLVGGGAILNRLEAQLTTQGGTELLNHLRDHPTDPTREAGYSHVIDGVSVDARSLVEAALAGERAVQHREARQLAQTIMLKLAQPLGTAVGQVVCLLDPAYLVLGGIIADSGVLETRVRDAAAKVIPDYRNGLRQNHVARSYFWSLGQRYFSFLSGDEAPLFGLADWVRDHGIMAAQ